MWVAEEEQIILKYLKAIRGAKASAREIARKAGTKDMWKENERWAVPHLSALRDKGLVQMDSGGAYSVPNEEDEKRVPLDKR